MSEEDYRVLSEDFEHGLVSLCIEFFGESGDWFYDYSEDSDSVYIRLTVPKGKEES